MAIWRARALFVCRESVEANPKCRRLVFLLRRAERRPNSPGIEDKTLLSAVGAGMACSFLKAKFFLTAHTLR